MRPLGGQSSGEAANVGAHNTYRRSTSQPKAPSENIE